MSPSPAEKPSFAARLGAITAWVLPVAIALGRTTSAPQWRGDHAAIRDLALGGVGFGGGVSTMLAQLAILVPVGSLTFRTALVSVAALGVVAHRIHAIVLRQLRGLERSASRKPSVWGAPLLATIAALGVTMTPTFQSEATVGGGGLVAAALALVLVDGVHRGTVEGLGARGSSRNLVAAGLVLGLLVGERPAIAGLGVAASIGALVTLRVAGAHEVRLLVPWRIARLTLAAAAFGAVVASLPFLVRSYLAPSALALRLAGSLGGLTPLPPVAQPTLLGLAIDELGIAAVVGSVAGLAALATRPLTRPLVAAIGLVLLADAAGTGWIGETSVLGPESALASRLVSLALVATASTAGLFALLDLLIARRIPLARHAAAMIVAFHATTVALVVEQAEARADRLVQAGADAYTGAALDALPPSSVVWVDEPASAWRLFAAQHVEGRRADVIVAPRRAVLSGQLLMPLLARERAFEPLFRAIAIDGATDELALSELADRRPLFVEPERAWGPGMYDHLGIEHAFCRFHPEPRGSVERGIDVAEAERRLGRLLGVAGHEDADGRTAAVVASMLRGQAKALLRSGEPAAAARWLTRSDAPRSTGLASSGSLDVLFAGAIARLSTPHEGSQPTLAASKEPPSRARRRTDRNR